MSGYPPGVTGMEYEIAGPDFEEEREEECPHCDTTATVLVEGYRGSEWYRCEACGKQVDLPEADYGPDPDEAYDAMRDEELTRD